MSVDTSDVFEPGDGEHLVPVRRALLSVSDKAGLVGLATALSAEFGVTLLSTGGTAQALREAFDVAG